MFLSPSTSRQSTAGLGLGESSLFEGFTEASAQVMFLFWLTPKTKTANLDGHTTEPKAATEPTVAQPDQAEPSFRLRRRGSRIGSRDVPTPPTRGPQG